jgi:predicted solute-binding protein
MRKAVRVIPRKKSNELDFDDWLKKSPAKKLDTLQYLREMVYDLKNENRKGLQRFLKVTQRQKS